MAGSLLLHTTVEIDNDVYVTFQYKVDLLLAAIVRYIGAVFLSFYCHSEQGRGVGGGRH